MRILMYITYLFVIIGAINWGLVGLFNYNLVGAIFGGDMSGASRFIYSLVGLSGLTSLLLELTVCRAHTRCYVRT